MAITLSVIALVLSPLGYKLRGHSYSPKDLSLAELNSLKEKNFEARLVSETDYERKVVVDKLNITVAMGLEPNQNVFFETKTSGHITRTRDLKSGMVSVKVEPVATNRVEVPLATLKRQAEVAAKQKSSPVEEHEEFHLVTFTFSDDDFPEDLINPGHRWERRSGPAVSKFLFRGPVSRKGRRFLEVTDDRKLGPFDGAEAWLRGTLLFDPLSGQLVSGEYRSIKLKGDIWADSIEEVEDSKKRKERGALRSFRVAVSFVNTTL